MTISTSTATRLKGGAMSMVFLMAILVLTVFLNTLSNISTNPLLTFVIGLYGLLCLGFVSCSIAIATGNPGSGVSAFRTLMTGLLRFISIRSSEPASPAPTRPYTTSRLLTSGEEAHPALAPTTQRYQLVKQLESVFDINHPSYMWPVGTQRNGSEVEEYEYKLRIINYYCKINITSLSLY